jgi:hypothetical protein
MTKEDKVFICIGQQEFLIPFVGENLILVKMAASLRSMSK